MQFKATVLKVMPIEKGVSKAGNDWQNQTIITETDGQYPKKVALKLAPALVDKFKVGQVCEFHVDFESREYNDRWYSDIKCWKFEAVGNAPQSSNTQQDAPSDNDNGLPF